MSNAAERLAPNSSLRVFISAPTAARLAALARILVETGHVPVADEAHADVALAAADGRLVLTASGGAGGSLEATADAALIDAAIRAVAAGLVVQMPHAKEPGFHAIEEGEAQKLLTAREIEVLSAIGAGLTNKEIARQLKISLHTVKFHVEAIFRKLDVTTRTGALAKAAQLRLMQTLEL